MPDKYLTNCFFSSWLGDVFSLNSSADGQLEAMRDASALLLLLLGFTGCSSGAEKPGFDQGRSVFYNPYGHSPFFVTNATTEHPPYIICNDDRCAYLDSDGNYTRMSENERRDWRERIRLAKENRSLKEDELFAPPEPPEARETGGGALPQALPQPGTTGAGAPD